MLSLYLCAMLAGCGTAAALPAYSSAKDTVADAESIITRRDLTYPIDTSGVTTPSGYAVSYANLDSTTDTDETLGYLTYRLLTSYSTSDCASFCEQTDTCVFFNMFYEKDPGLNNEPVDLIKCALFSIPQTNTTAVEKGQYRGTFLVRITGSNGYNKIGASASSTISAVARITATPTTTTTSIPKQTITASPVATSTAAAPSGAFYIRVPTSMGTSLDGQYLKLTSNGPLDVHSSPADQSNQDYIVSFTTQDSASEFTLDSNGALFASSGALQAIRGSNSDWESVFFDAPDVVAKNNWSALKCGVQSGELSCSVGSGSNTDLTFQSCGFFDVTVGGGITARVPMLARLFVVESVDTVHCVGLGTTLDVVTV